MAITRIHPPPTNVDANDFTFKKWFQDIYYWNSGGILVPSGGIPGQPTIFGGTRNVVRNGDMQIWQRGTSFTSTGGAQDQVCDGWAISRPVNQLSVQRITNIGLPGFQYAARVTRGSADTSTASILFSQALETRDTIPLAGQTVTLSFWARTGSGFSSSIGLNAKVDCGTGVDERALAAQTGTQNVCFLSNIKPTTGWKFYQTQGTLKADRTDAKVYFYWNPLAAAGSFNYIDVTGVQLEVGTRATAFDYRTFAQQLGICSRYYQKSFDYDTVPANFTGVSTSGTVLYTVSVPGSVFMNLYIRFVPMMRTTPTFTFYNENPVGIAGNWFNISANRDSAAIQASNPGQGGFNIFNNQVVADTQGQVCGAHFSADTDL